MSEFIWHDLMTSDIKAAEIFYKNVIGWEIQDSGLTDRTYLCFTKDSVPACGLMPIPEGMPNKQACTCWSGYIYVDDVDGMAKKITQAGGSIFREPQDIPDVGRFAVMNDPQGATFILFAPSGPPPTEIPPLDAAGHIGWHELYADDIESALAFYAQFFGWTKAGAHDMGEHGIYQLFAVRGKTIGGIMRKPAALPQPFWLYYLNVDSITIAQQRVEANGGKILFGPEQVPEGKWIMQCLDPQGAMFALLAPRA